MSTSSSEKIRFLTTTFSAFLVISSVVSCSLGVMHQVLHMLFFDTGGGHPLPVLIAY